MNDHQQFQALLDKLGLSRRNLAKELGLTYESVRNQLAPAKTLPKWAKAMLLTKSKLK